MRSRQRHGKYSGQRIEICATSSNLRLDIGPKRKPGRWSLLWAPVGLVFWAYGMYETVGEVIGAGNNSPLILSFLMLAGLVVFGVAGPPVFLWSVFGSEVVEVLAGRFIVAREFRSFRYSSRSFNTLGVEGLRADDGPGSLRSLLQLLCDRVATPGKIAFGARGKTYRFGPDLDETEFQEVAEHVNRYLPQMRSRS